MSTDGKHLLRWGRGVLEIFPETEMLHMSLRSEYKGHLVEGTACTTAWRWHMAWPGATLKPRMFPEVTKKEVER